MNPILAVELVLIPTQITVKNDYEKSRSIPTLAKKAWSMDINYCACQLKINLSSPLKDFYFHMCFVRKPEVKLKISKLI